MENEFGNYREILREAWMKRLRKNPSHSLRAFARELGLAPSRLSEIFQGKQGLSRKKAMMIGQAIGMSAEKLQYFCDLVEQEHARSSEGRSLAQSRLKHSAIANEYQVLSLDAIQVVADWHHLAILQALELPRAPQNARGFAELYEISESQAQAAIDRLIRLMLVDKTSKGKLKKAKDFMATPDGIPSSAIRRFHGQILEKASEALETQSVEERNVSANLFNLNPARMKAAKNRLLRFRRKFVKDFGGDGGEAVYCLSMQLFELSKTRKK